MPEKLVDSPNEAHDSYEDSTGDVEAASTTSPAAADSFSQHRVSSAIFTSSTKDRSCAKSPSMKGSRKGWLPILTLVFSVYSSALSGLFVVIAITEPGYGKMILPKAKLTASSTALATAVLAKTIEISFVTVVLALVGQELSRRASGCGRALGVSLAELHMRNWIMQPGTMFSKWESIRYAGGTLLGLLTVVAALLAMLYTSAAAALVQPQLRFRSESTAVMQGMVRSSFANPDYIVQNCSSPRATYNEAFNNSNECIGIEQSEEDSRTFNTYLRTWNDRISTDARNTSLAGRPKATSNLADGTLVVGSWLHTEDSAALEDLETGTIVNNVSLALPHMGVMTASKNPINNIVQPEELEGLGSYDVNGSVSSPVLHTLCATVSEEHISSLMADRYGFSSSSNTSNKSTDYAMHDYYPYLNGTRLDHIFKWGEDYGDYTWPPLFSRLPTTYEIIINSTRIINSTGYMQYGRPAIYALGKSNGTQDNGVKSSAEDYYLCQMQVSQTPFCFTNYHAIAQRTALEIMCDDTSSPRAYPKSMRFIDSLANATSGNFTLSREWLNAGVAETLPRSLGIGVSDVNSSNAKLISQLLLRTATLNPERPSLAEALAVLVSGGILQSTRDAPFVPFFNYTAPSNIMTGRYQYFNASVRSQQYASGGSHAYEKAFNVVLVGVFALNLLALVYFAVHGDWYTDISEPTNLFSLAINAPSGQSFPVCGGAGPKGKDYSINWTVEQDDGHVFIRENRNTGASHDE
jgi:hypothetical protein